MDPGEGVVIEWRRGEFQSGDKSVACDDRCLVHGGHGEGGRKESRRGNVVDNI